MKRLLTLLMVLLLAACSGGDGNDAPSQPDQGGESILSLQVTPVQGRIPVGLEQQFIALATMLDGSVRDVTDAANLHWSSSDGSVAAITATGLATGITPGSVTITASGTANGSDFSATAALTVTSAVVTALQVTPTTASIPVGFEQPFVATAFLSDGSALEITDNAALSWSSSAPAIATIDSGSHKGLATGRAAGSVTITASGTANGTDFSATAALTVTGAVVTALQVTPATASVAVGFEQPFVATAFLSDGSALEITDNAALSWSSSAPAIATIDSGSHKGLATGRAAGSVTITASGTANGTDFSATAALTVTGAVVTALQVTPATASVAVGFEQPFVATAFLSDGSALEITDNAALSWSSSAPAIATIDSGSHKGLATGRAAGSVTITASGTANGTDFSATAALTVTGAVVTVLQVTPATASVAVGFEQPFVATAFLSDGSALEITDNAALSWSSSAPAIATIDSGSHKGLATGRAAGSVTITASGTANGTDFSATAALTVTGAVVTALQVTPATASIPVGFEQPFVATAFLSDGSALEITDNAALSWSSSAPAIATIDSGSHKGLATGRAAGSVTITASGTANGTDFSATAALTVTGAVVTALQVTPATASIPVGFEQPFVATAFLSDGSALEITDTAALSWSSSAPAIATIDSGSHKGLATGRAAGSVTITASGTANGTDFSATAALTVTGAVVTALQVTPATASIPVGFEQPFVATATLSDGSALEITDTAALSWSSSAPAIATIDSSSDKGLATGRAAGSVTITASGTANGTDFSATAALTVTGAVVTALQVTPATASIPVGFEQPFVATATLSDGSALDVTDTAALSWSSSAPAIATIDSSSDKGLATGIAAGSVTITASGTANGTDFSATAALTVTGAVVTALQVTPATASIPVGFEQPFVATATLSDGSALDVTDTAALSWSSSAPAIATIDSSSDKGLATGIAAGSVTITASGTANGTDFSATAALTVTGAVVTALQVTPATASIPVGFEQPFVATATLSDGSALDVTDNAALSWSSSAPAIATIDSSSNKGLATGRAEGSVTITAAGTANGTDFSATAALTVTAPKGCTIGTLTNLGLTFICPPTKTEADANGISYSDTWLEQSGHVFVLMDWGQAETYCNNLGNGYRLPTLDDLRDLYFRYGPLHDYAGWPFNFWYWTSTGTGVTHSAVNITNGDSEQREDTFLHYVSCVQSGF